MFQKVGTLRNCFYFLIVFPIKRNARRIMNLKDFIEINLFSSFLPANFQSQFSRKRRVKKFPRYFGNSFLNALYFPIRKKCQIFLTNVSKHCEQISRHLLDIYLHNLIYIFKVKSQTRTAFSTCFSFSLSLFSRSETKPLLHLGLRTLDFHQYRVSKF